MAQQPPPTFTQTATLPMLQEDPRPALRLAAADLPLPGPGPHDYDALAELFLGPRGPRPAGAPPAAAIPRAPSGAPIPVRNSARILVEGLILGHLPVMGSAWAMQYARDLVASGTGPVGMVRIRGETVSVEVIGAPEPITPAETFIEAMEHASPIVDHWLVRAEEISEPLLAAHGGLDRITLLSGADQAATVAAYRTIKGLFSPNSEADSQEGREPVLRIAIVGAPSDRSAEAQLKLSRAAEAFLGRPVEVIAGPERIAGAASAPMHIFTGELEGGLTMALSATIRQGRSGGPANAQNHRTMPIPMPVPDAGSRGELDQHIMQVMQQAAASATPRIPGSTGSAISRAAAPAVVPPSPGAAGVPSALAAYIGLEPLVARCPYALAVEMATDPAGRLHLLARFEPPASGPAGRFAHDAVRDLLTAGAWAMAHASLLQLAHPSLSLGAEEPALHLFTADARAARHMGETRLRMHLLAPVTIGGQHGWYCTDLN
jgi:hypothetical protein